MGVTVAEQPRPYGRVGQPLHVRLAGPYSPRARGSAVRHRARSLENSCRRTSIGVTHRAQHQRADDGVEPLTWRILLDGVGGDRDRHRALLGRLARDVGEPALGLDGDDFGDRRRVELEVGAGTRSDLQHASAQSGHVLPPQLPDRLGLAGRQLRPQSREERIVDRAWVSSAIRESLHACDGLQRRRVGADHAQGDVCPQHAAPHHPVGELLDVTERQIWPRDRTVRQRRAPRSTVPAPRRWDHRAGRCPRPSATRTEFAGARTRIAVQRHVDVAARRPSPIVAIR